jgi:hypothetical protein
MLKSINYKPLSKLYKNSDMVGSLSKEVLTLIPNSNLFIKHFKF